MAGFQKKTIREKEWKQLEKKEQQYKKKKEEKKESVLNQFLEEKVPETLQTTLNGAFYNAFRMVFEKGTAVIEKTYKKEEMELSYKINAYAFSLKENKKSMQAFSKKAKAEGNKNLLYSGVEGIGLGLLGIGIPDIPLFVGMILKSVYQISLSYGINYNTKEEHYFILKLICGALSYGKEFEMADAAIESYIRNPELPENYIQKEQIKKTSTAMAKEVLYMKFLQGLPVVGAVGGVYDAVYLKNIIQYADLKYKKRFLMRIQEKQEK